MAMADQAATKSTGWDKLPLLTKSSFTRWKYEMSIIITAKGLSDIVLGRDKGPEMPELPVLPQVMDIHNPNEVAAYEAARQQRQALAEEYSRLHKAWIKRDAEGMQLLSRGLEDHHHLMIRGCEHARHIWTHLINLYQQKTATSVFLAQRQLHECT